MPARRSPTFSSVAPAVLQRKTHQADDDVVETDQVRSAVGSFMDADVEGALSGDFDFLGDMIAAVGEDQTVAQAASTMPWKGISQEGSAALQSPSNPVEDTSKEETGRHRTNGTC